MPQGISFLLVNSLPRRVRQRHEGFLTGWRAPPGCKGFSTLPVDQQRSTTHPCRAPGRPMPTSRCRPPAPAATEPALGLYDLKLALGPAALAPDVPWSAPLQPASPHSPISVWMSHSAWRSTTAADIRSALTSSDRRPAVPTSRCHGCVTASTRSFPSFRPTESPADGRRTGPSVPG